ncbi:MAG TPA: matrixin family metalloprotease [Nannocystis sp.]
MKIVDLSLFANLFVVGCIDDGQAAPDDVADAEDVEELEDIEDAPAGELDGLQALAPEPGSSVWSEVLLTDGTTQQFMLHTTLAGEVVFEELSDERFPQAPDLTTLPEQAAALGACSDDAYILQGWRWKSALRWSFHAGSTPDELTVDAAEAAITAATASITSARNSCGLADEVDASHEYLGRKHKGANIGASGNCLTSDGDNVVSFGDLPQGVLATACVWFHDGVATEGDVQLNKQDYTWTTNPGSASCSKRWSVRAVMTHERGHTFGLAHVGESTHGDLTMSPSINGPCQDSESTLGDGDVQGLAAMY